MAVQFPKTLLALAVTAACTQALAGQESATSEVTGEIVGACTVAADNTDFGQISVDQAGTTVERTVNLTVNCSNMIAYSLVIEDQNVTGEFLPSLSKFHGYSASIVSLSFSENTLPLALDSSPIGVLSYWTDPSKSTPFDVGAPTGTRSGSGADQTIPVTVAWTLPESGALTANSFSSWKVTNTYKVIF